MEAVTLSRPEGIEARELQDLYGHLHTPGFNKRYISDFFLVNTLGDIIVSGTSKEEVKELCQAEEITLSPASRTSYIYKLIEGVFENKKLHPVMGGQCFYYQ